MTNKYQMQRAYGDGLTVTKKSSDTGRLNIVGQLSHRSEVYDTPNSLPTNKIQNKSNYSGEVINMVKDAQGKFHSVDTLWGVYKTLDEIEKANLRQDLRTSLNIRPGQKAIILEGLDRIRDSDLEYCLANTRLNETLSKLSTK
jgi:hypothetical protein